MSSRNTLASSFIKPRSPRPAQQKANVNALLRGRRCGSAAVADRAVALALFESMASSMAAKVFLDRSVC